ncbi:6,7-dimethyl-8-ribityllumazine synthase [Myxococcota bacterium]|nr:6,7-dimethyl-8-ribityllumazine synthase [Myxococcota bacterium]
MTANTNSVGNVFEGNLIGEGLRFAVIASRFNHFITERLIDGALDAFTRHGANPEDVDLVWTPGTFEMPLVARRLADSGKYDAVACVGAVIRGGTPHFDYVATQVARGVAQASWDSGVPVAFGIITADTIEQSIERAGTKAGNKGFDAALAAIEMAQLLKNLPK